MKKKSKAKKRRVHMSPAANRAVPTRAEQLAAWRAANPELVAKYRRRERLSRKGRE
jgi:hypothetical protein